MLQDARPQTMCPICTKAFSPKDVVIKYARWEPEAGQPGAGELTSQLGHLDCVLHLSLTEEREHPPIFE